MLAPQQTIMRASAILRCKGATAKLDFIWILNTIPFRGFRCANMQRRSEAKHCSSLCSQSEGDEYCGGQTRLKIQRRYALKRWLYSLRVRGPHFASKVSYNAGAATDDYAGQRKTPLRGRPLSRFVHSTTVALRRKISLMGRSEVSVLTLCMALTTSRPMVTSPNTVYWPSSQGVPPFLL